MLAEEERQLHPVPDSDSDRAAALSASAERLHLHSRPRSDGRRGMGDEERARHPSRPKQAASGATTKGLIYDTMVDLMFDQGYHAMSMRDVARRVHIQTASVYYHYSSKQAMLFDLMSRTMADLTAATENAVTASAADPVSQLTAAVHAHIAFHINRRKESFLADSELRSLTVDNRATVNLWRDRYERVFRRILEAGIESGHFRQTNLRVALSALMAISTGVASWYTPSGQLNIGEVADAIVDLFLTGMLVTSNGARHRA